MLCSKDFLVQVFREKICSENVECLDVAGSSYDVCCMMGSGE